jgi:hypothetical protein
MPLSTTGQDLPPPNPNPNSNPAPTTWMTMLSRRLTMVVVLILGLFLLRNMLFKNYTDETKNYLTKIGRSDAIDKVIPKTSDEYANEQQTQYEIFQSLVKNMSVVIDKIDQMEADIKLLKAKEGINYTVSSIPISSEGGPKSRRDVNKKNLRSFNKL